VLETRAGADLESKEGEVWQVYATLLGFAAATVLQPGQDAPGQSRKTTALETPKTAYMSGFSDRAEPVRKALT
jgi:hypothetical protein